MNFSRYLSNLPLLHSWDGGATWNTGGFEAPQLQALYTFLKDRLGEAPVFLETGAGNSTITMLYVEPRRLISIAPDADLYRRIRSFCKAHAIRDRALEEHIDGSQWVLPFLAGENRNLMPFLDFALIDGCHGWPTTFVDLEYINSMLKRGGYLMIDDMQLHSEKEMARLLSDHPAFSLALDLRKSVIFRKETDQRHLGEWLDQPYIVRKSTEYARLPDAYALNEPSKASRILDFYKSVFRSFLRKIKKKIRLSRGT